MRETEEHVQALRRLLERLALASEVIDLVIELSVGGKSITVGLSIITLNLR